MYKKFLQPLRTIFMFSVSMIILCGIIYPLTMTVLSQMLFPSQANGSIHYENGQAVGSDLIGQNFTDSRFMKGRPSAVSYNTYTEEDVASGNYSGVSTGSNNMAPSNPDLIERIQQDLNHFMENNPTVLVEDIPTDLLTASGSGLDPHISVESALIQVPALIESTGLTKETLMSFIEKNTTEKVLGIFGETYVNVLGVNIDIALALDLI